MLQNSLIMKLSLAKPAKNQGKALLCKCAFGILRGDFEAVAAIVSQIMSGGSHLLSSSDRDSQWLLSRYFLMQGGMKLGARFLTRAIHMHPSNPSPWNDLVISICR
jgi:hypothetical protein